VYSKLVYVAIGPSATERRLGDRPMEEICPSKGSLKRSHRQCWT